MKLENIIFSAISTIREAVQPVARATAEATVKLALGGAILTSGCNWFVEKSTVQTDLEQKTMESGGKRYRVSSATLRYHGKVHCNVENAGEGLSLIAEKKSEGTEATEAKKYTIMPTGLFDFEHRQGKKLSARVVCPGDRWNLSLLKSAVDLPYKVEYVSPPPLPPPLPPPSRPSVAQAIISAKFTPPGLVVSDGTPFTASIITELVYDNGKHEAYQQSSCSLRKVSPAPARKFSGEYYRLTLPFIPRQQLVDRTEEHKAWTPYQMVIECKDNKKQYQFSPYELGILVEKQKAEIIPKVTPAPQNRLPVCQVLDGEDFYNSSNGISDERLPPKNDNSPPFIEFAGRPPLNKFYRNSTILIDEGDSIQLKIPFCSDPDGDSLEYSVSPSGSPGHIKLRHYVSGKDLVVLVNPTEKDDYTLPAEGPDIFKVSVRDYRMEEDKKVYLPHEAVPAPTLKIRINPVNDLPHEKDLAPYKKRPLFSPLFFSFSYSCKEFFDDNDNSDNDAENNDSILCTEEVYCAETKLPPGSYTVEVIKERRVITIFNGSCEGKQSIDQALDNARYEPKARLVITASDGKSSASVERLLFLYPTVPVSGKNFQGTLAIWGDSEEGRKKDCRDYLHISPAESLYLGLEKLFEDGSVPHRSFTIKTDGNEFRFREGYSSEVIARDILGGLRASVPTGQKKKEYGVCATLDVEKRKDKK